jgi:hypothetical protein
MGDINNNIVNEVESVEGQELRTQTLDDATFEPGAYIERAADYQQAEDIQNNLMIVTDNAVSSSEQVENIPAPIPRPEDSGVVGGQPDVRGDLDNAETNSGESAGDQATPINLPGPQQANKISNTGLDEVADLEQPEVRTEGSRPGSSRPGNQSQDDLGLGGQPLGQIDDIMTGNIPGLEGDPFGQGGALPSAGGTGRGTDMFGEDSGPGDFEGSIQDDLMGAAGIFQGIPGEGPRDPGLMGGGPGSVNPMYGGDMAGKGSKKKGSKGSDNKDPKGDDSKNKGTQGKGTQGKGSTDAKTKGKVTYAGGNMGKNGKVTYTGKQKSTDTCQGTMESQFFQGQIKGFQLGETGAVDINCGDGTHYFVRWSPDGVTASQYGRRGQAKMPRPDGEEGTPAPRSPEDIDKSKAAGTLVTDPAYTQGGAGDGMVVTTKHPGHVTDPPYEGSGDSKDGGIKSGAELVTDPPEETAGKSARKTETE